MYPPPAGKALTYEQAQELDDTYLSSDPFQYFSSRIASLLTWHDFAPVGQDLLTEAADDSIRAQFNLYLQRPAADGPFRRLDVHAQVAADALNVRHHAAEALLRLACARPMPEPSDGAPCLWAAVAVGPRQIDDVIKGLNESANAPDPGERMFRLLFRPLRGKRLAATLKSSTHRTSSLLGSALP